LRLSHIFNWGGDVVEAFFSEVEAGAEAELPIEAKAVTAGNETKRDRGRGGHPEAEARQMETEAWKTETRGKQNVGLTRRNQI